MKPMYTIIRAAFALALIIPAAIAPFSQAAEAYGVPNRTVAVSQVDSSSVRPGPGAAPSQSVGTDAAPSTTVRPAASATPGAASQPAGAGTGPSQRNEQFGTELLAGGRQARAGSLIVKFRSGTGATARNAAHQQVGSQSVEPVGNGKAVRVQVEPGTLAQAVNAYAARPDVEGVVPDYLVYADMVPTDPKYSEEWNLPMIGAPAAWDRVGGGSGIKVAVLDTGVYNHADLQGRVVLSQDFTGSPYGPGDRHGHGTHVAGTVAANANNGIGVVGVAWQSSLLNGKVLGDTGSGSISSVANGIVWAADNGAKVISMSLGANLDCPEVLQDAIDYAWDHGAVLVAAAGNSGMNDAHTPANCNHVVPVGAVNSIDAKPSFSNYGPSVPITAPGDAILSTSNNGDYVWMAGTSMSTPHAAGVAALVWASSYGTSNQAVISRVFSTADRIAGTGSLWVYGRINAAAAVAGSTTGPSNPTPPPTPSPSPSPSPSPTPPVACDPRPPVTITTAKGAPGTLNVTVRPGAGSGTTNRIQQVRFGPAANALVEAGARSEAGTFALSVPASSPSYTFTIRRTVPGTTVTVPLTIVDGCGDWNSFVGGGPTAF